MPRCYQAYTDKSHTRYSGRMMLMRRCAAASVTAFIRKTHHGAKVPVLLRQTLNSSKEAGPFFLPAHLTCKGGKLQRQFLSTFLLIQSVAVLHAIHF